MKLHTEVDPGPGHIVLDGDPAPTPHPKKGHSPQFLAHVCCSQTAGWIKMPLGAQVSLGLGHIVLHGDPASPKRGAQPVLELPIPLVGPGPSIESPAPLIGVKIELLGRKYIHNNPLYE